MTDLQSSRQRERVREWRRRNPEKVREACRKWRAKHQERVKEYDRMRYADVRRAMELQE